MINEALELLGQNEDFMDSVSIVADMGCGLGQDSHWWATREDSDGKPRNYFVFAVDKELRIDNHYRHKNIRVVKEDYTHTSIAKGKVDVVWCANAFQYAHDPVKTLNHWWNLMSQDGLLYISVPQTNYIDDLSRWQMICESGVYWPHNMTSLIYLLAANGFDCRDGHFKQQRGNPMLHLAVYKSPHKPMDMGKTSLYDLVDLKLLPASVEACILKYGCMRHEFLEVEWIDHSIYNLAIESIP